ncbi:calcium homeostasis modulator protein 5-like [Ptychodera flava]|uniref:calcium homeostasis modulator protein 5-like n=1 Tax=Ptychodera flava TaxID=63121 RepID=UPI003969E4C1
MGIIKELSSTFKDNITTIRNLIITLFIFVAETYFEKYVFKCPCKLSRRKLYSWILFVGPSVTLFVIGILLNNKTWKIVMRCCKVELENWCNKFCKPRMMYSGGCLGLLEVSLKASVGAFAWIVIAFMNSTYYACGVSTVVCGNNTTSEEDEPELDEDDKALSQSIGWGLLAGSSVLILVVLCFYRMCGNYTYEHQRYAKIYEDVERKKLDEKYQELAEADVKKTMEMFFSEGNLACDRQKCPDDVYKEWAKISLVGSNSQEDCGYTSLQGWAILKGMESELNKKKMWTELTEHHGKKKKKKQKPSQLDCVQTE